jgi:CheY-like chemotaxis protein
MIRVNVMNESRLIEQVLRIINNNYSNIYVIDILDDKVYAFDFNIANNLYIKGVSSYTDFIESAKRFVYNEDLNDYFGAISLNKLELESQKGNQETKIKYRRLSDSGEYRYNVNIINYLPFDNKKLIFMMSEDVNNRLTDTEEQIDELTKKNQEYQNKLNDEYESIGSAIYEINNALDLGINANNNTRNYINSVFSKVSNDNPELNKALANKMVDSTNYTKPAILIVDDSSIIRNSLKRIFSSNYEIVMAKNGNEAIDIITKNVLNKDNNNHINIVGILLDLVMPGSDGFVVLDFLKNFNLLKKIPVAIISGDETKETRRRVYEYDIVDMLEKPFNTENIRKRIGKIISMYMSSNNLQNIISTHEDDVVDGKYIESLENISIVVNKIVENAINSMEALRIKKIVRSIAIGLHGYVFTFI